MPSSNKGLVFKLHLAHSKTNVWETSRWMMKTKIKVLQSSGSIKLAVEPAETEVQLHCKEGYEQYL